MLTRAPSPIPPEVGALERLGDQRDREAVLVQRAHRQADAVERHRALLAPGSARAAGSISISSTREKPSSRIAATVPVPSTWPCTTCPPRRSAARSGSSRFTRAPALSAPERGALERLGHRLARGSPPPPTSVAVRHTPLTATESPSPQLAASSCADRAASRPRSSRSSALDAAELRYQSREHRPRRPPVTTRAGGRRSAGPRRRSRTRSVSALHRLGDALDALRPRAGRGPRCRPAAAARGTAGSRRSRRRRGTRRRGAGRPRAAPRLTPCAPSWSSAERTRAGSFSPVATSTCTPAASSASVSARAAARETTTRERDLARRRRPAGRSAAGARASRTRPAGAERRRSAARPSGRAVSCGSSASAVPMPTTTASTDARQRWASSRLSSPLIHFESPVRVATLPSSVIADLNSTHGRPTRACLRKAWLSSRALAASSPSAMHDLDALVAQDARGRARRPSRSGRRRRPPRGRCRPAGSPRCRAASCPRGSTARARRRGSLRSDPPGRRPRSR